MKKTVITLTAFLATTIFSGEGPFSGEGSVEELLLAIDQKFEDQNEKYQKEFQQQKDILEEGVPVLFNLGDYTKSVVPMLIDKYMEIQDVAFEYAKSNPEIIEDGTLILPENPVGRDYFEKVYVVGLKILFSDEKDYQSLRSISFEKEVKKAILWDIDDDFDYDVVDKVEHYLKSKLIEDVENIIKNSTDPLLSKFVYPEIEKVKEDPMAWLKDNFIQYKDKRVGKILTGKSEPENPIEEKIASFVVESKEHSKNFAKSQKMAMNLYINSLLTK